MKLKFSKSQRTEFFIHIGLPKTGTTSIQFACYNNSVFFKNHNILYPKIGLLGPGQQKLVAFFMNEDEKRKSLLTHQHEYKTFDHYLSKIKKELSEQEFKRVVISSERFSELSREASLKSISDQLIEFDVQIIVWIKRQDHLLESLLAQNLRVLNEQPIEKMLENSMFNLKEKLELWEDIFGLKSMHVRHYKSDLDNKLITDFLNIIGIDDYSGFTFPQRANTRLSRDALHFLNHECELEFGSTKYQNLIRYCLVPYSLKHPTRKKYKYISAPALRIELLQNHLSDNKLIGQKYFEDEELLLKEIPNSNDSWEPYPGLSDQVNSNIRRFIQETQEGNKLKKFV